MTQAVGAPHQQLPLSCEDCSGLIPPLPSDTPWTGLTLCSGHLHPDMRSQAWEPTVPTGRSESPHPPQRVPNPRETPPVSGVLLTHQEQEINPLNVRTNRGWNRRSLGDKTGIRPGPSGQGVVPHCTPTQEQQELRDSWAIALVGPRLD